MQAFSSRLNFNYHSFRTVTTSNAAITATNSQMKSWTKIPGPSSLPVLGQLHHYLPGGSLHNIKGFELWDKMYKTYGPIVRLRTMLMPDIVVLMDAKSMSQIYHGENSMPKRPGLTSIKYFKQYHNKTKEQSLKPKGLALEDDEIWRQLRSKLNPLFLPPSVLNRYSDAMDEVAQDMIARLKTLRNDDGVMPAKFDYEINLWALESIALVVLGGRINCLTDFNLSENSNTYKLINIAAKALNAIEKLDMKPSFWKYYPTKAFKAAMKTYEDVNIISKQFINEKMQIIKASNKFGGENGIFGKLLEVDEDLAVDTAIDTIGGGIENPSSALIATLYLLATNPEKQQKLRKEVTSKQEKVYLKACIKEALRLRPPSSINFRHTTKEYKILDYHLPKGVNILFCHLYTSLMETQYPRPNEFIPERWIVNQSHPLYYGNADPFAFAPFGFGVRTCIARRIVQMELEALLTRIIENFRIEWTGPPPNVVYSIVNNITGPFSFIFKDV